MTSNNYILIPSYNDYEVVYQLINKTKKIIDEFKIKCNFLIIDDGSTNENGLDKLNNQEDIKILKLKRNLGHQRAIAVGLAYLYDNLIFDFIIVMDGDGEDDPAYIPKLLNLAINTNKIVFASRERRSEGLLFIIFYNIYKFLHFVLTGIKVDIGNFSVIPRNSLKRLTVISEMWNHYAAAVVNAKVDYLTIPTNRAKRISGKTKMNFLSLISHGFSALSVHLDLVLIRALFFFSIPLILLVFLSLIGTNYLRIYELIVLFFLLFFILLLFTLLNLKNRILTGFILIRDYIYFIDEIV
jgi:hypothetical protein